MSLINLLKRLFFVVVVATLSSELCVAFLPSTPITTAPQLLPASISSPSSSSRLYGIQEWRDQAYEENFTLLQQQQVNNDKNNPDMSKQPNIPSTSLPILPFPFTDILMQGERKQLNLYEKRFHDLFEDAMDNHHGMLGMGLLLGRGMITTLPLCEVESFTRLGFEDNYVDKGDGMGNGSIFVTIRAVGRVKIAAESDLMQEEPYFKAKVIEILDEPVITLDEAGNKNGLKERRVSEKLLGGLSSPIQVGSLLAGTIENLMVSLSSMEHKLREVKKANAVSKRPLDQQKDKDDDNNDDYDKIMNRRLEAARLEELFMRDSTEGVDFFESNERDNTEEDYMSDDDDDDDDDGDYLKRIDRVRQFQEAFESAKESDNQGYILSTTAATDNLSSKEKEVMRSPKDLTAISWAAFCTGDKDNIQRRAIQIQALDMTNVIQRLQLASGMLREEQKSLKAKLALAGIIDGGNVSGDESS